VYSILSWFTSTVLEFYNIQKRSSSTDSPHQLFIVLFDTVQPEDGHRRQPKHVGVVNKQSSEIKNTKPITKIKNMLFNFLIEKSLYSAEEFMTMDPQLVNCE
jgi:hypothetical protein